MSDQAARPLDDPRRHDRPRAFAMTAIAQCREARARLGRGRHSLWAGDIGLACNLRDLFAANPQFPTVDACKSSANKWT